MTESEPIAGRYVLGDRLGRGGMGVVWRAEDTALRRSVAVKEVPVPAGLDEAEQARVHERLRREGRAAARLSHPGVVTIYDVVNEDDRALLVMELVEAEPLDDLVDREGPLAPERAAAVGLEVLDALEAAHREGVVHRDVKPGNVLMANDGAKLTDFGIASLRNDARITQTGQLVGSPSYMAPEQADNGETSPASDLWGLAATLHFAVEGAPPFDRGEPLPTLHAVVHDDPAPPARAGEALGGAISAAMTKDPDERADVAELRRLLGEAMGPAAVAPGPPAAETGTAAVPAPGGEPTGHRRRTWLAVAGAALVLLLGIGLAGVLDGEGTDQAGGDGSDQAGDGEESEQPGSPEDQFDEAATPNGGPEDPEADNPEADDPEAAAPADWTTYTDETGYSLSHPPDWEVVDAGESLTDFRDPDSSTYLRVDYTDDPPASAVGAWEELSSSFASDHQEYSEIRLEPTTYQGYDAAIWEYTYFEGGVTLRATNLGFGSDEFGQALNFQTTADDWEASRNLYETFETTFEPADPGS